MSRSLNKMDHFCCRADCQVMRGESWPWTNVGCHFTHMIQLLLGASSQQGDHRVIQCNDSNAKLHQLRIRQWGALGLAFAEVHAFMMAAGRRATLVFPPG